MDKKIHLAGSGFSGRGVRLRVIDGKQKDLATATVAKRMAGAEPTGLEWEHAIARECLCMMIVGVTEPGADEAKVMGKTGWKKATYLDLTSDKSDMSFDKVFSNPKDVGMLTAFYRATCVVLQSEVDAIMGKALTVDDDA